MTDAVNALSSSAERLGRLVQPLGDAVSGRAYPSGWTVADVVSHIGSGAVIFQRRLDDALTGHDPPQDLNQQVWAEWDAKSPRAKAEDGLAADAAFVARLESTSADERAAVQLAMGPMQLGWEQFVGLCLNEHLLHEWDIAVSLDPDATLADDGTGLVIDNLGLIASFTARPQEPSRTITIHTFGPERWFAVTVAPGGVEFSRAAPVAERTLAMPAEAFIRVVYGRLDPEQTPASVVGDADALAQMRQIFPGP